MTKKAKAKAPRTPLKLTNKNEKQQKNATTAAWAKKKRINALEKSIEKKTKALKKLKLRMQKTFYLNNFLRHKILLATNNKDTLSALSCLSTSWNQTFKHNRRDGSLFYNSNNNSVHYAPSTPLQEAGAA